VCQFSSPWVMFNQTFFSDFVASNGRGGDGPMYAPRISFPPIFHRERQGAWGEPRMYQQSPPLAI
jgi:hypothetical protein